MQQRSQQGGQRQCAHNADDLPGTILEGRSQMLADRNALSQRVAVSPGEGRTPVIAPTRTVRHRFIHQHNRSRFPGVPLGKQGVRDTNGRDYWVYFWWREILTY